MAIPAMEMILPQTSGSNTPAFLAKLWKMVNNPEIGELGHNNKRTLRSQRRLNISLL